MLFNLLTKGHVDVREIPQFAFDDLSLTYLFDMLTEYDYSDIMNTVMYITDVETIKYRQGIFSDCLNNNYFFDELKALLDTLIQKHEKFKKSNHSFYKQTNFLLFIKEYINFINSVSELLINVLLESEELIKFKDYILNLKSSTEFVTLVKDFNIAYSHYKNILRFSVSYDTKNLKVSSLEEKENLEDKLISLANSLNINLSGSFRKVSREKVSGPYLTSLVKLYNEDYNEVVNFYNNHKQFNFEFGNLSYELRFYIFFKKVFKNVSENNIPFSKSEFNNEGIIEFLDVYDVSLLDKTKEIIPNDVMMDKENKIQFVSGVNSGGKTSYIRSIGLNYILFLQVGYTFSKKSNLFVIKNLLTHFPIDENFKFGFGRLNDELARLDKMSQDFNNETLVILNETFSSTDEETALKHTKDLLTKVVNSKTYFIFVTHQQKIFREIKDPSISIMSPLIDVKSNNKRLYKIRKVTDKESSYTYDILYKYGMTKEQLTKKLESKDEQ